MKIGLSTPSHDTATEPKAALTKTPCSSTPSLDLAAGLTATQPKPTKGLTIRYMNEFVQSHFLDGFLMKYLIMIIYYKILQQFGEQYR